MTGQAQSKVKELDDLHFIAFTEFEMVYPSLSQLLKQRSEIARRLLLRGLQEKDADEYRKLIAFCNQTIMEIMKL
jgi:hypothetical protein